MNMHEFLTEHGLLSQEETFAAGRQDWNGEFTAMQEEVVCSPAFWEQNKNVIIHGPTSSGKTLLAEIAALSQIQNDRKVLFLVPLRVLVTSQCRQLQRDFEQIKRRDKRGLEIFESSADYQDHDAQILNGKYNIAVIVYEKFFSMLNNSPNHILQNCGLIVVDELQMLSSADRGPKMEFSIMKVLEEQLQMRNLGQSIRIIGMTTSESGVDSVCNWLHADSLGNDIRPVTLKQHFVSYSPANMGEFRSKYIPGCEEQAATSGADTAEQKQPYFLDVPPTINERKKNWDTEKKSCFFAILNRWMDTPSAEDQGRKILIFSNTKRSVRTIAGEIAGKFHLFTSPDPADENQRKELQASLNVALSEFCDEEDINELDRLIPHGIAFHHSGLPSTVREAIEEDFRSKNGRIQVIVCTETLMIGVNLPADVVILYDNTVFRGEPSARPLTLQEYKNFIGRAGRLGLNTHGESYMLTDNLQKDFETYTSEKKTEIVSSFKGNNAEDIAPYFMSWIGEGGEAEQRIRAGLETGFCCSQRQDDEAHINKFAENILEWLQKLKKEDTDGTIHSVVRKKPLGLKFTWTLTRLGKFMAPYALTLETDAILLDYVIHHRDRLRIEDLKLEVSKNKKTVPGAALLEFLYMICQCTEIDKNPVIQVPSDDKQFRILSDSAQKYLRKVYPTRPDRSSQEEGSRSLAQLAHMQCMPEKDELRGATRAVILALWMAGCSISSIRKSTGFNLPISTSDVERLAESVAYLMETVSKCQEYLKMDDTDISGMYALSTSMKYGVPRSLLSLANTHTRGVTRPFLLKIGEESAKAGKTTMEYVLASTDGRYSALQKALRDREYVPNYVQQIENKTLDITDRFNNLLTPLKGLDSTSQSDPSLIRQKLEEFFTGLSRIADPTNTDAAIQVHAYGKHGIQVQFTRSGQIQQIYFQILHPVRDDTNSWIGSVWKFGRAMKEESSSAQILTRGITVLCGAPPAGEKQLPSDHLVISSEMLGVLLLACLLENADDTKHLICRVLSDLRGAFIMNGSGFFNEYGQLWNLVKGYSHPAINPEDKHLQLFYYPGIFDYKHIMPSEHAPQYIEFPWGRPESISGRKRATFYHPAMQYSRQSDTTLQSSKFIFCSADDFSQVQNLVQDVAVDVYVKDPNMGMDTLLCEIAKRLAEKPAHYTYDVGISFRGQYEPQMCALKKELERQGKCVLCMNTDTFEREMAGDDLISRLRESFSRCRHIIACDTFDYDQSVYTLTEYNVILDKLSYALREFQRTPVYLVRIPNVARSKKLSDCFRYSFTHSYNSDNVPALATSLIQQMNQVEQSNNAI